MLAPWRKSYDQPRQHIQKQRHYFTNKVLSSQSYGFSSSYVWMWELDHVESWASKNWCFWIVVLENSWESLGLMLLLSHFSRADSMQPHWQQPTRLPCPWDSPGKNTGVGCHFLLQCVKVKLLSRVPRLVTPWTAAYEAPPSMGFSRRVLEWGAIAPGLKGNGNQSWIFIGRTDAKTETAFHPWRFAHLTMQQAWGIGYPLRQVECFETGSGESLQTEGKTTKPVKDSKSQQRSQRAWVVGEVPRFHSFVLGQENMQRERKRKACMFQCSAMIGILL